ncbi:MAG: hypothetical protein WDO24_11205 [Pseudomonadota bacterium]
MTAEFGAVSRVNAAINTVEVTDAKGIVVARGHNPRHQGRRQVEAALGRQGARRAGGGGADLLAQLGRGRPGRRGAADAGRQADRDPQGRQPLAQGDRPRAQATDRDGDPVLRQWQDQRGDARRRPGDAATRARYGTARRGRRGGRRRDRRYGL